MFSILSDEMGLGKTIQTLAFLSLLVEKSMNKTKANIDDYVDKNDDKVEIEFFIKCIKVYILTPF